MAEREIEEIFSKDLPKQASMLYNIINEEVFVEKYKDWEALAHENINDSEFSPAVFFNSYDARKDLCKGEPGAGPHPFC